MSWESSGVFRFVHEPLLQGQTRTANLKVLITHCNSSRVARDALVFFGPSAALNRDPTPVTSVNNTSQTVPQPRFQNNPQHFILHTWCLGVDSSKNKASLWKWQRELLPLTGHQQGPSTSQSGPHLSNGAENSIRVMVQRIPFE